MRIAGWVSADSYCEESNKSFRANEEEQRDPARYMDIYKALVLASGFGEVNPCILALLTRSRPEALRLSGKSAQESCRLIKGLLLTGQWSISTNTEMPSESESAQGRELLSQLMEENSGNGFFSLMALGSMRKAGEAQDREREEIYLRFLRSERFINPLRALLVELHELGHQNSTALLYSIELTSTVGVPNFAFALKAAKEIARKNLYPVEFSDWLARLGARFEENERLSLSEPVVNLLEDAIQKAIAVSGARQISVLPPLLEREGWIKYFKNRALPKDLTSFIDFNEPCEVVLNGVRRVLPAMVQEDER